MTQKREVYLIEQAMHWGEIESLAQHAVVQVSAQIAAFNWLQPYKMGKQSEGIGSGFFINADGFFVTNVHVIAEAKSVWIYLPACGREPLYADIVSICPEVDIALLKLQERSLNAVRGRLNGIPHLILGDSDAVLRTQGVLTLGYPLGQYRLKSTTGVISGREVIEGLSLLETTAPINPGSSGGPLLNAYGQVVGITVASVPQANSIGYAIPINELTCVLEDLARTRLVHKPVLGAQFSYGCDEKAHFFGNPVPVGIYVNRIFPGSLLDTAGIAAGDMLYEFNGLRLDAYGDVQGIWTDEAMSLRDVLSHTKSGNTVTLIFYRAGEQLKVSFPFEYAPLFAIRTLYPEYEPVEYETIAGLVLMELTENHIDLLIENAPELYHYELSENRIEPRIVITHLIPGSYAYQMSMLKEGDIVTHINDMAVHTLTEVRQHIVRSKKTGYVTLRTQSGMFVVLSLARILDGEERLHTDFMYPISQMTRALITSDVKKSS